MPKKTRSKNHAPSPPGPPRSAEPAADEVLAGTTAPVPVVAVAASAGGLHAFQELLSSLPADTGMAFVLIQHLDPRHHSILSELLGRSTTMPVTEVIDGVRIEPDHVYVIPPNHLLSVLNNTLHLMPAADTLQRYHPADSFFEGLAADRRAQAVGVVLSGTASNGTKGCLAIKAAGGTTFAQDNASAEYDGMPGNAVAAGCIDFVMSPKSIAHELARIARHPQIRPALMADANESLPVVSQDQLNKIFILLRSRTGQDFSGYKPTTVRRRIGKRLMVQKIDKIEHYIKALQQHPDELDALFDDLLINVTAFFRDPDAFEDLRTAVLPQIFEDRPADLPIRVWVPGCSTGQEAYSIAMLLHETLGQATPATQLHVQIFGSDIDEDAIETARRGVYPDIYLEDLVPARKERYFHRVAGGYQVSRFLRDMCVFAVQNIIKDPPFSRLDLISCRNLLIYLNSTVQKKVLSLMHYALQPGGYLMLGTSETIGSRSDLYSVVSKKHKIYRKKSVATRINNDLVVRSTGAIRSAKPFTRELEENPVYDLDKTAENLLLQAYVPPGVIVSPNQTILRFIGRTWPYIEAAAGTASLNLYKNAHPDIAIELRSAIHKIGSGSEQARKEDVRIDVDGKELRVDINVISLGGTVRGESNVLVMFEPQAAAFTADQPGDEGTGDDPDGGGQLRARNLELEREISSTRDYMQSIVEDGEPPIRGDNGENPC